MKRHKFIREFTLFSRFMLQESAFIKKFFIVVVNGSLNITCRAPK
jgi:hypothetical protein